MNTEQENLTNHGVDESKESFSKNLFYIQLISLILALLSVFVINIKKTVYKNLLLLLLLVTQGLIAHSTNYYVKNGGNDANSGLSDALAKETIDGVNDLDLVNDSVFFNRGDTFRGELVLDGGDGSNIYFGAYGTGDKPIITGFTDVTAWTDQGSNIWESTDVVSTMATCNMVVVDGELAPLGRYPNRSAANGGYLFFQSHSSDVSITSSDLTGTPDWTGAEVVIRMNDWNMTRKPITAQSSGTLTFSGGLYYSLIDGHGFFIQNDVRTLDVQNEWYYNPTTKKLSIYSTSEPSNVKVSSIETLMLLHKDYLTMENITFEGSDDNMFFNDWNGINNTTIKNCTIRYAGMTAVKAANIDTLIFTDNVVHNVNSAGVFLYTDSPNATISDNVFTNIGINAGMGRTGQSWGNYSAITAEYDNQVVSGNVITNVGYDGINFSGNNTIVENNVIDSFCLILADGAGIYTHYNTYTNMIVRNNIVLNAIGDMNGVLATDNSVVGIYLDEEAANITLTNNSVLNGNGYGLFFHYAHDITMRNNTIYNHRKQFISVETSGMDATEDCVIKSNIFVSKAASQEVAFFYSETDNITNMGDLDSNYYARPIDDDVVFTLRPNGYGGADLNYTLSEYQTYMSPQEANSQKSPTTITSEDDLLCYYNDTTIAKTYNLGVNMIDIRGTVYNGSVTLEPFTSVVLLLYTGTTYNRLMMDGKPIRYKY